MGNRQYCRLDTVYRPGEDSNVVTVPYRKYTYKLGASTPFVPTATITDNREPNNPSGVTRSSVLGDGLGRVIQQKAESVVDSVTKVVATTSSYDSAGNLWLQFVPEAFANGTSFETYTQPTQGKTTMLYDAVGRLTRVTHADDTFRTINVGVAWETTTQDECFNNAGCTGSQTVEKQDALGRTVERTQSNESGAVLAATQYGYDELGRLRTTTQSADGTTWNTATTVTTDYDSLGRTVKVTDPDAGPSGAAGVSFFGYDPAGNLRYRDDPASNQHVQLCYDALDRVTKKQYFRTAFTTLTPCTFNASEQITYVYDSAAYGVGRLYRVTDRSGETKIPTYTPLGQPVQVIRTMDGVSASTTYAYDTADHLQGMLYPDNELVGYLYDAAGRVKTVANGSSGPVYLQNLTYDVFGRPRGITHGNGMVDTREYETTAAANYRLKRITAAIGFTVDFQYEYATYQASGRLTQLNDTTPTSPTYPASLRATATFDYDGLGRLVTADDTEPGMRKYCYDPWGNIRCKDATSTMCNGTSITCTGGTTITYSATKAHQPISATGATFQHDANGNRTSSNVSGGLLTYRYDLDDRLRLIKSGSDGSEFTYDYSGRRTKEIRGTVVTDPVLVEKVQPGDVTYHYTDFLEVTGSTLRKYYFAGDLLIASRETTAPPTLQVASVAGDGAVQVASLFAGGGPALILRLSPDFAQALALALALSGGLLLCLPHRRRPCVVGIRIRPTEAAILAIALTLGTLPWPLLVRPTYAKGGPGPTPTPVPSAQIHHYHLDHLGSPQVVTDGSGGVVQQIRYTPYGEMRIGTFTEQDDREFTGDEKEPFSELHGRELYYAGERFYDADFALFLSHDPARQFASPYTYTDWNPIGRSDPNGAYADVLALNSTVAAVSNAATTAAAATTTATAPAVTTGAIGSASSSVSPTVGENTIKGARVTVRFEASGIVPSGNGVVQPEGASTLSGTEGSSNGLTQALAQGANEGGTQLAANASGVSDASNAIRTTGQQTPAPMRAGNLQPGNVLLTGEQGSAPIFRGTGQYGHGAIVIGRQGDVITVLSADESGTYVRTNAAPYVGGRSYDVFDVPGIDVGRLQAYARGLPQGGGLGRYVGNWGGNVCSSTCANAIAAAGGPRITPWVGNLVTPNQLGAALGPPVGRVYVPLLQ